MGLRRVRSSATLGCGRTPLAPPIHLGLSPHGWSRRVLDLDTPSSGRSGNPADCSLEDGALARLEDARRGERHVGSFVKEWVRSAEAAPPPAKHSGRAQHERRNEGGPDATGTAMAVRS